MGRIYKGTIKVAVIDMNNGSDNQGIRGIQEILLRYQTDTGIDLAFDVFDLRQNGEIPGISYDVYIASGGPGSPYDGEGQKWEKDFFDLLDDIERHNIQHEDKKYAFLICHSFQMACRKFNVGKVTQRKSASFGIFPVFLTERGKSDIVFNGLANPFYTVDSRDWQVINTGSEEITNTLVLALEKKRPHIDLQRCIMSVRFTKEIIGTQFHPEADPNGMKLYLLQEDKKSTIIKKHGNLKYSEMLLSLDDPDKISLTQSVVLPNFLNEALNALQEASYD